MLFLMTFFVCLGAVIHVRSAISNGALEQPYLCLNERHSDWRFGKYPAQQELRITADQVRRHYLDDQHPRAGEWHLHGALAGLGVWLAYSASERRKMALGVLQEAPDCPPRR